MLRPPRERDTHIALPSPEDIIKLFRRTPPHSHLHIHTDAHTFTVSWENEKKAWMQVTLFRLRKLNIGEKKRVLIKGSTKKYDLSQIFITFISIIWQKVFVEHVVLTPKAALICGCKDSPHFRPALMVLNNDVVQLGPALRWRSNSSQRCWDPAGGQTCVHLSK